MPGNALARIGWIARSMTARVVVIGLVLSAVVSLLYSAIVPRLPKGPPKPTMVTVIGTRTSLPRMQAAPPLDLGWDGLDGLQAVEIPGERLSPGQPLLKFTGSGEGRHRIGITVRGLDAGQRYRVTANVRAPDGMLFRFDARDGRSVHEGRAVFDVGARTSTSANGLDRPQVGDGPDGWVKLSAGLQTADGSIVVYVGLLDAGQHYSFAVTRPMHFDFGGIEVTPE